MKKCILLTAVCLAFGTAFGTVFAGLAYLATEFNKKTHYNYEAVKSPSSNASTPRSQQRGGYTH